MGHGTAQSPEDLLRYNASYSVLICTDCGYAIQPSGIGRHLKEKHQIYRSRRRPFLEYASQFNLAKPEEVAETAVAEFPVPLLPVLDGLRCRGVDDDGCSCGHLCVSTKRMQQHWLAAHGRHGTIADWHPVPLQTFFRGNELRYFTGPVQASPLGPFLAQTVDLQTEDLQSHPTKGDPGAAVTKGGLHSGGLDHIDQKLLHHYTTATYLTLVDRHGTEAIWRDAMAALARQHDFLMHALLACSALHLAHLVPAEQKRYLMRAQSHQDSAMPLFRRAITNVTEDNCHAVLAFAHLLVVYSFAADQPDERLLLADPSSPHPGLLSSWLYFIRNGCLLVCDFWDLIERGPLGPLAQSWESALPDLEQDPIRLQMQSHLLSLIPDAAVGGTAGGELWPADICETYRDAAARLSWALAAARTLGDDEFTTWDAVRLWPMEVPVSYMEILSKGHPAALVLLAHYCRLLERLEPHWYFEGRAGTLIQSIIGGLSEAWRERIMSSLNALG
ncbi:Mir1 [Purpureocillium lavendulum]|uniref:Mir1 n=1 Tax=Purpureocillium lavendulum TaxID=1247861 RepID=A0AB34G6U8_9HYPO|nr:Mir1 [Purpureocillium lavendulum]